jgi:hypothetical protein
VRGMASGTSATRLPSSRGTAHQRHRRGANTRQQLTCQRGCKRRRQPRQFPTALQVGVAKPCRGSHAIVRLSGGGDLRGATSAPATEGAARGGSGATSGELSFAPALRAWAGRSAVRTRPEPTFFSTSGARGGGRSRCVGSPEPPRAQPRHAEHH